MGSVGRPMKQYKNAASELEKILIYLDMNIVSRMQRGEHSELKSVLTKGRNKKLFAIPFTSTHVEEAGSKSAVDKEEETKQALGFLSKLTKDLYIYDSLSGLFLTTEPPTSVQAALQEGSFGLDYVDAFSNLDLQTRRHNYRAG